MSCQTEWTELCSPSRSQRAQGKWNAGGDDCQVRDGTWNRVMGILIGYYFQLEEKFEVHPQTCVIQAGISLSSVGRTLLFLQQPPFLPLRILWLELTPFPTLDFRLILFSYGNYVPDDYMTQWSLWELYPGLATLASGFSHLLGLVD